MNRARLGPHVENIPEATEGSMWSQTEVRLVRSSDETEKSTRWGFSEPTERQPLETPDVSGVVGEDQVSGRTYGHHKQNKDLGSEEETKASLTPEADGPGELGQPG